MLKVIHLIPHKGIGGVERAAESMRSESVSNFIFNVEVIFPPTSEMNKWLLWNPFYFICAAEHLWQIQPDILIVSLWRACVVGIVLKLLRPHLKLVLFLHFPRNVHLLDRFLTWFAARLSYKVLADSSATLSLRLPALPKNKGRLISFVTERIPVLPSRHVHPVFVFWGRIHKQKGLDRALRIFSAVHAKHQSATFLIIGPDKGDLVRLKGLVNSMNLREFVHFLGGMDFCSIQHVASRASFYLQTSLLEGMGMSVVEAMQMGLLPVVTPVGEIANFTCHGENALVVIDDSAAVTDVLSILEENPTYQMMREKAAATWSEKPLYNVSMLDACREFLL